MYDASLSICASTSISTRKSMCALVRCKHKKKNVFLLLMLAHIYLCHPSLHILFLVPMVVLASYM